MSNDQQVTEENHPSQQEDSEGYLAIIECLKMLCSILHRDFRPSWLDAPRGLLGDYDPDLFANFKSIGNIRCYSYKNIKDGPPDLIEARYSAIETDKGLAPKTVSFDFDGIIDIFVYDDWSDKDNPKFIYNGPYLSSD